MDKNTQEKAVAELRALLKPLIDHFRKEHNLSQQDMISLITGPEEMVVPVSIFSIPLGPLQCLVKYLKEEHGMKYVKIAAMLNKDQRVIWKSYSDANKKFPSRIEIKDNDFFIPITMQHQILTVFFDEAFKSGMYFTLIWHIKLL